MSSTGDANRPIRVGIVGANTARGWARDAHVPALDRLRDRFALAAVSARTRVIAEQAAAAFGAARAFDDSLALARDPDVDLVVVAVKVPEHRAVVLAALAAGKHVYCEWPLGRDVAEAEQMARAVPPGRHAVIGLQALSAPAVLQAACLVRDGVIGRPKRLRVVSPTAGWGATMLPVHAYTEDRDNGATLSSIAGGHTLAAIESIVGAYAEVDARASVVRERIEVHGTATSVTRTSPDNLVVVGLHENGCVSTLEVVGGSFTRPLAFELEGERGSIRLSGGDVGGLQAGVLRLDCDVPHDPAPPPGVGGLDGPPANVAELYLRLAGDLRSGLHTLPDFEHAVRLSRLLHRIEQAAATGRRQFLLPATGASAGAPTETMASPAG